MTATPIHFHKKTPDQLRVEIAALVQQYSDIVHAPQPFVPGESPFRYLARSSARASSR